MTMRMRVGRMVGVATAGVLALTGVATAQPGAGRMTPEEHQARIEAKVHERLAPKLGLDEKTADRLASVLSAAAAKRHAARATVRGEREALRGLLDRKASDAELEAQLRKLADAQKAVPGRDAVLEETRGFLTVEQQARLTLLMSKDRRHGKRGGHMKPGQPRPGPNAPAAE